MSMQMNTDERIIDAGIGTMALCAHDNSVSHGFWEGPQNKGEKIALMHSELSEMLEGVRKPGLDQHCPEFTQEEIEAADVLIRLGDYAHKYGLRLGEAVVAKMRYNASRPHKHGKAF